MCKDTEKAFFELIQAGLFGLSDPVENTTVTSWDNVDWREVYRLAEEQSVIGLVAAGIDYLETSAKGFKIPKRCALQFIGQTLKIEQRNKALNGFINELIVEFEKAGIRALIVKGQGVAQCYEKPLWRASGDVDFYMDETAFQKAKVFFRPRVNKFDPDNDFTRHINMHDGPWVIEIHGNQYCSLSSPIDQVLDDVHQDLFSRGNVRCWLNDGVQVFLPSADNDVIILFTHFLKHFYKGGLGIRQICDWSRLLWTFRDSLDIHLLEQRLRKAGLMDEWRAFGVYAVSYLGMPIQAMPLFDSARKWQKKAERINEFILEVGNFGHNRDTSYYGKYPFLIRKTISFGRRLKDIANHARIFPLDSLRFMFGMTASSLKAASHGE